MSRVEIVAHRGANDLAPENSLAAAELCVSRGIDWLEIDVRSTKDGVMYNLHDRTLRRTSGGKQTKALSRITSAQADAIDIGSWFAEKFSGERLPRVESLVAAFAARIKFFFDVKDADFAGLIDLVRRHKIETRSFFWFWSDFNARRFHRMAPELAIKINAGSIREVRKAKEVFDAQIIECGPDALSRDFVSTCHSLGMKVMVMTGSDDPVTFRRIIEFEADMVNLDHVDAFLAVRDAG